MSTNFPNFPTSGKNSKILMNSGDGALLSGVETTLQVMYRYKGKAYQNVAYKLGAGRTLVNMRPEKAPVVHIDGILSGLDIVPHADKDKVTVTAGIIEVDGAQVAVSEAVLTLDRPTSTNKLWHTVVVSNAGAVSSIKGKEAAALLDAYGTTDEDGKKPYAGDIDILVGVVELDGITAAVIAESDIDSSDKEYGNVDYQILPNTGVILLGNPLAKCHAGGAARGVKFTGYVLDTVMAEISTAKSFSLTPSTSQMSEETFSGTYSSSSISGYSFSYEQLAADKKALDNATEREGHCGIRLQWPNGFYMQFVGTLAPTLSVDTGSYNKISVTGSCGDAPARSDEV